MTLSNETTEAAAAPADAIEITQHVAKPVADVWRRLTQREGIEALLGEGAMLGAKGDPWHAADGTYGVTRSYHPAEQVRVSWHADEHAEPTLVDVQMAPEEDGTRLTLRHEHLTSTMDREALTARWQTALQRLAEA